MEPFILIVWLATAYPARGEGVAIEHIEFSNAQACREAFISMSEVNDNRLRLSGVCVRKGDK